MRIDEYATDVVVRLDRRAGSQFSAEPRRNGGISPPLTWVWVGELDADDVEDLRTTWRLILAGGPSYVVIDMAEVSFLDCRVLSFLAVARQEADSLFLRSVSPFARRLLTLAHLGDLVTPPEPEPLTTFAA